MVEPTTKEDGTGYVNQGNEIPELHEITGLEALRTIADPLRLRVYEVFAEAPQTVKDVAARLGLTPGRLYYHVNLLEEHGLIKVVEERLVGNLVEKRYRAVARRLDVAPDLLSFRERDGRENLTSLAISSLDATREDLIRSLDARRDALARGASEHLRPIMVTRHTAHIHGAQAEAFVARLVALQDDFDAAGTEAEDVADGTTDVHAYALSIAFYPQFDFEEAVDD